MSPPVPPRLLSVLQPVMIKRRPNCKQLIYHDCTSAHTGCGTGRKPCSTHGSHTQPTQVFPSPLESSQWSHTLYLHGVLLLVVPQTLVLTHRKTRPRFFNRVNEGKMTWGSTSGGNESYNDGSRKFDCVAHYLRRHCQSLCSFQCYSDAIFQILDILEAHTDPNQVCRNSKLCSPIQLQEVSQNRVR